MVILSGSCNKHSNRSPKCVETMLVIPCLTNQSLTDVLFLHFQSAFNKSLSQKIRHTRLSIRTRSRVLENPTAIPCKRPRQSFNALLPTSAAPVEVTSEEAVDRHVAEIVKEWDKPANSRSTSHLFALLKATRNDRQQMLSSSTVGCMSLVFQKYPMLQDYKFVSFLLALLCKGTQNVPNCTYYLQQKVVARSCHKTPFGVDSNTLCYSCCCGLDL